MSTITSEPAESRGRIRPAAPVPTDRLVSRVEAIRLIGKNAVSAWGARTYELLYVYDRNWIQDFLLVNDPEGVKHVLLDNVGNYVKSRQVQRTTGPALGNGLFNADGESWRTQRRTAAPMAAVAEKALSGWRDGETFDAADRMMQLTYKIITHTMFSDDVQLDYRKVAEHFVTYLDTLGRVDLLMMLGLPHWAPTPKRVRAGRAMRFFRHEIGALVRRRAEEIARDPAGAPKDLLTLLLTARDPEGGASFTHDEVYDNVLTFIFSGHETTANTLAWTLYLLSQFPEVDAKVAAEVRAADGDIVRMPYTRQVLEESLRLYPAAPFISRDSVGPDRVGPHDVRGGTSVLISPWLIQRHRKLWKDPDYFDPERFAPGNRERIHRFAYIPFGAGPRICIGMGFAMQEALICLSQIVSRWRLEMVPGHLVATLSRLTLRPEFGLQMTVHAR
ncbi:MAG: cytochrome P450 [Alphaproteobacteria bacterium]|nr:cytochrome P450 [Alphaproteobacteria bacterium]